MDEGHTPFGHVGGGKNGNAFSPAINEKERRVAQSRQQDKGSYGTDIPNWGPHVLMTS